MTHGGAHLSDSASVDHNTAGRNGGGMIVGDTSVRLNDDASIHDNTAGGDGGGVWTSGSPALLVLNDRSSVSRNAAARDGGGLFVADMTRVAWDKLGRRKHRRRQRRSGLQTAQCRSQRSQHNQQQHRYKRRRRLPKTPAHPGGTVTLSDAGTISDNHPDNCYPPGSVAGCASCAPNC